MKLFLESNWHVLLPAALGFIGLYLLLPRPRRYSLWLGGAFLAAALAKTGVSLLHAHPFWAESMLFYAFAGLAVLAGIAMLTHRNPVYAALAFALVVLSTSGLFLLLAAPFLMAATIIVYAGAIVVTFLFVIMLAQQAGLTAYDQNAREPLLACVAGFVLLAALFGVLQRNYDTSDFDRLLLQVQQTGQATTIEEANQILGAAPDDDAKSLILVDDLRKHFPPDDHVLANIESHWNDQNLGALQRTCIDVLERGQDLRAGWGGLKISPIVPASRNAGPFQGARPGQRLLPANNVANLGKALFTDYLAPVGLAGFLLLVASIGAIAIAGRGKEGLR